MQEHEEKFPSSVHLLNSDGRGVSTAIVKLTPISGSRQEGAPACYLLEIDQIRILLDAGTNDMFDLSHFGLLRKLLGEDGRLDVVLLSHGDLAHCGGLAHLMSAPYNGGRIEAGPTILATLPVHHLGLVATYDAYQSHFETAGHAPVGISLDDLDAAYDRIIMLRYSQSYQIPSCGLQVTPLPAGHTLGGAFWRIKHQADEIIYLPTFNHRREAHLDGAALDLLLRPSLMIGDVRGALQVQGPRKDRDRELIDVLGTVLKAGGTALVPVDGAARTLELLQVVESWWTAQRWNHPVFFLGHQSRRTIELVKGMVEWMGTSLAKVFDQDRVNPFELRVVKMVHRIEEVCSVSGPKVVIATVESMDSGLARVLCPDILTNSRNAIILTRPPNEGTLAAKILQARGEGGCTTIKVTWAEEVELQGEELAAHHRKIQEAQEMRAAEMAFAALQRRREEEEDYGEDEEEEEEEKEEEQRRKYESNQERLDYAPPITKRRGGSEEEQIAIASAVALQHVYWTDYRHDWFVMGRPSPFPGFIENSPYYPLIPPELLFTSTDGAPNRYQCFPFKETRRFADDYGEAVTEWTEFGSGSTTSANTMATEITSPATAEPKSLQLLAPSSQRVEADQAVPLTSIPKKWKLNVTDVTLQCAVKIINMEGVSDGRALRTIYQRIAAKRLVLVGGSVEGTELLANRFKHPGKTADDERHEDSIQDIFTPAVGTTVTICSSVNVIPARLAESLIGKLQVHLMGDYELAWIDGTILSSLAGKRKEEDEMMQVDGEEDEAIEDDASPTSLSLVIGESEDTTTVQQNCLVGDVRMSELRRLILRELPHIPAIFQSGDLICGSGDRKVAIRKDLNIPDGANPHTTRIVIEGPLSEDYYAIRDAFYSSLAFLTT